MTGEDLLFDAERLCDDADDGFIALEWTGKGDEHGHPWPDIRVNLAIMPQDEGDGMIHGLALPRGLMDDTKALVRFEKGVGMMAMTPPAPREDVVMALDAALARFGEPSCFSFA